MDIKNLTTFLYAAELNSFTKAAEHLGFSQSTVSFQMKQLETELRSQLFERVNHTIALTEKGREVLRYAQQVTKLTQELQENMQEEKEVCGHVRMAMAESLCDVFFSRNFNSFYQQYPRISLKIYTAGTMELLRLVNQNEADMILTLDSHIYHTEYEIVREERVGVHFVTGADYPIGQSEKFSICDLIRHPFLLTEKGMSYRRMMDERLAELSLEMKPVLEIGNTTLICSLLTQNLGISFLPDYVTEQDVAEGRLRYLEVEEFEIEVWKQLLHHRKKWISPQMEAVMKHCVEKAFSDDSAPKRGRDHR